MRTSIPLSPLLWLTALADTLPPQNQPGIDYEDPEIALQGRGSNSLYTFANEESKLNEEVNMLAEQESRYSGFDLFEEFERIHTDFNRMEDESSEKKEIADSTALGRASAADSGVNVDELETYLNIFRHRRPSTSTVTTVPEAPFLANTQIPRAFNRPIMAANPSRTLPFADVPPTVLVPKDLYYQSAPKYLQKAMPWEPVLRAVITPPSEPILLPTRPVYSANDFSEYPRELLANRFALDRTGFVVRVIASESTTRPFNRVKDLY